MRGVQKPRIQHVPPGRDLGDAQDVIDLARSAGLLLDPWQEHVLRGALRVGSDGRWSAFEVGLLVSRQNGKGAVLEALELAWLFLFDDQLILHSAHEFKTASEAYLRIKGLIDRTPDLKVLVKQFYAPSGGQAAIHLHDGTRLEFVARSKGSGRGFSADKIVLDEAYNLPDAVVDALLPTTGAKPNPQIWYTSSAGDQLIAPCDVLARVRRRGVKGEDARLAYFEWSVPYDELTGKMQGDPADPKLWAMANPSLGIRKPVDRVATFHESMSAEGFAREELSVGNWPLDGDEGFIVPNWSDLADPDGQVVTPPVFALEVTHDRSRASVCVAGGRADGRTQVELVESRAGTSWAVDRLSELSGRSRLTVVVDPRSPAGALVPDLESAGVSVYPVSTSEWVSYCGQFMDACAEDHVRHLADPDLTASMRNTVPRRLGEAWALDRLKSRGEITAFAGAVLAAGHYRVLAGADYDPLDSVI